MEMHIEDYREAKIVLNSGLVHAMSRFSSIPEFLEYQKRGIERRELYIGLTPNERKELLRYIDQKMDQYQD